MATMIKTETYVKSDVNNNNNKFWKIEIYSDWSIVTRWGRVGDDGDSKTYSFNSQDGAQKFWDKKIKEKTRDGRNGEIAYRKIDVVGGVTSNRQASQPVSNVNLSQIAAKQIKTNNPLVDDLVKYLTKVNAHQICSASGGKITFSDTTGLFSTPLGIVTQDNIDQARDILGKIGDIVSIKDYSNKNLISYTNDLLMLVPQNVGRKQLVVTDFWSDQSKLQYQNSILDGLQASYASAISLNKKSDSKIDIPEEKVFDCQLHLVEDTKDIKRIKDFYNKTRQSMHTCHSLEVKKVYKVEINTVKNAWMNDGVKMENIWTLWHGTLDSHCLSILRAGLKKPSKSSSYVTGRMFSGGHGEEGLYFSDQSTKSLGYAYGFWNGTRNEKCHMFLCSVAMGKYYVPSGPSDGPFPHKGFDSTYAKANSSGVRNNEMIIYRESQCNLDYLIEFG